MKIMFINKKISRVLAVILAILLCGNLVFAKASDSEIKKEGTASISEATFFDEENDGDEIYEEDMTGDFEEEPEEDVKEETEENIDEASPSDAEEDEAIEEIESDDEIETEAEIETEIEIETENAVASDSETSYIADIEDIDIATPGEAEPAMTTPLFGAPTPDATFYMYADGTVLHFTKQTIHSGSATTAYDPGSTYSSNNVNTVISKPSITGVVIDEDIYPVNCRALFSEISGITSITNLNKLHTDCATYIGGMFTGCSGITSLDISHFVVTSACTNISYMFAGSGISSISFNSNWDTSGVTNMEDMFYGCPNLTSVNLSNINTSSVTDIHNMFYNCAALSDITIGSSFAINTATVNSSGMFSGCTSLPGYDPTKTDGTMLSTYTHLPVTPAPTPSRRSSSSGGGGGGGRINSLQDVNMIALHSVKTNLITNVSIDGKYHFLSPETGNEIVKRSWVNSDIHVPNSWYLVDSDGELITGFAKVSGKYYYLNPEMNRYGMMATNSSLVIDGKTYTFGMDGACTVPEITVPYYDMDFYLGGNKGLVLHNGYYYYFDSDGNLITGLYPVNDGLYYFANTMPEKGKLSFGEVYVNGVHYFCDPNDGGKAKIIG